MREPRRQLRGVVGVEHPVACLLVGLQPVEVPDVGVEPRQPLGLSALDAKTVPRRPAHARRGRGPPASGSRRPRGRRRREKRVRRGPRRGIVAGRPTFHDLAKRREHVGRVLEVERQRLEIDERVAPCDVPLEVRAWRLGRRPRRRAPRASARHGRTRPWRQTSRTRAGTTSSGRPTRTTRSPPRARIRSSKVVERLEDELHSVRLGLAEAEAGVLEVARVETVDRQQTTVGGRRPRACRATGRGRGGGGRGGATAVRSASRTWEDGTATSVCRRRSSCARR